MTTPTWAIELIIALVIVDIVLKAYALWRAARLNQPAWFVCLFIFNTAGILPIIYLFISNAEYQERFKK